MATKKPFPGAFHGNNHRSPTSNDQNDQYSVNLLQEDSDSDETEEPRYPWDASNSRKAMSQKRQWMRTQRSPSKKEQLTPVMEESPTTRALNIFSQNTNDLMQYRPNTESSHKLHSSMLSNDAKPSPPQRDLPDGYHLHWGVHPVRIIPPIDIGDDLSTQSRVHTQPLGAVIAREAFPMMAHYSRRNHCIIKRLHPDGLAMRCGLQQGDWFLLPMDKALLSNKTSRDSAIRAYETSNDPPQLATFDEIQEWSKDSYPNYRPIRVLRKKIDASMNKQGGTRIVTNNLVPMGLQDSRESKSQKSLATTESLPPYCILCNYYKPSHWSNETRFGQLRTRPKRAPRTHHTWCPKHKEFDAVRVHKRLARTKHCFQVLGCEACHFEYQTGKVVSTKKKPNAEQPGIVHNEACLLYQDMLKNEDRLKHKQEQEKLQAETRKKNAEAKKRKQQDPSTRTGKRSEATRQKRAVPERSSSDSENSDGDHGFEDGSIYQPPTRKARMETFAFSKKRKEPELVSKKKSSSKANQNLKTASEDSRMKEDADKGKPVWISMNDNPWGKECYQTGDILLFGPQVGSGHHETQSLSNERYKVSPFAEESTYNSTHATPAEGLSLIMLKRDAMGRMPWGFQTVRDEFGSACLVESVDPCSPASSATFLGVPNTCSDVSTNNPSSSALAVNDMIVLINGKQVGGMTVVGLELELEIAGPNLLLGVSRYKHAKKVANRFAEMERKMLDFMDRAARDERLMGWREIGCGDAVEPRETTETLIVANKVTPTKPQLEEDNSLSVQDSVVQRTNDQNVFPNPEVESMKTDNMFESKSQPCMHGENNIAIENYGDNGANQRSSQNSEDSAAHDDNPQMGCICGTKHIPSLIKTFWIQCESCDSWYHVAEKCIGFGQQHATRDDFQWSCTVCAPDTDIDEAKSIPKEDGGSIGIIQSDEARKECDRPTNQTEEKISTPESMDIQTNNDNEVAQEPVTIEQRRKKPSTPPALRELKSYNNDGSGDGDRLGYWEDFQTMSARGNPDRCLRKRQPQKRERQEPRTDESDKKEGGKAQLSTDRKKKEQSTKKTNHSVQNQLEKNTERDRSDMPVVPSTGEDSGTRASFQTFKVGDLVFVESHAWAYVNNSGGIGFVQKTYLGTDGDRVYDVKYPALDRTEKGIMAEYISPYSFD